MKQALTLFLLLVFTGVHTVQSQGGWSWMALPNMPQKVANNAVTHAVVNDTPYVYSFFGIDTTKIGSGIHSKAFRYNTITQVWDTIPDVPDSLGGVIAAGASTIRNKIYIIGGYHVYPSSDEVSSYEVHIYDPVSNTYTRGADIPIEIDDHVQVTYKDSLIYVISGWTSSIGFGNNTNAVQVYDAVNDQWYAANDMPNSDTYKVFGASGAMVGDTIYFAGGARYATNFPLMSVLRKGVIDTSDPLSVTWSSDTVISGFRPYRAAVLQANDKVFWAGGASTSYNYDGIAYNGSGGVNPNQEITEYNARTNQWAQYDGVPFNVMDLRGAAKPSENEYIICGGMNTGQSVSDSVFLLTYDTTFASATDTIDSVGDTSLILKDLLVLKVKKNNYIYHVENYGVTEIRLFDLFGRMVRVSNGNQLNVLGVKGIHMLHVTFRGGYVLNQRVLID